MEVKTKQIIKAKEEYGDGDENMKAAREEAVHE